MICSLCATAADRHAPKNEHCTDDKCMCGHRTGRYAAGPNPAFRTEPETIPEGTDGQ